MYPISNDLLALFQGGGMQYARLTIGNSTIGNDRIKQGSFSINRYVETNESVAIGSVVAAELVFVVDNYDGAYDNTNFVGAEAYVEIGVKDSNNTVQYIPMGYFTFDEATRTKNTVSLAALDRMTKFDVSINASDLSFPYTLTNLLTRICTLCGVTKGSFGTITNSSYSVASLPSEAKTYRDLLRWICEVSGSNGYFSYDGKLYLGWYGTTSQVDILPSNRTQSDIDKDTFTITGVTILTGDNQKYTAGTNVRPITINNNPFITASTAQSVANTLNTKLNWFTYTPFTATMLPSPHLWPMDRGTFATAEGTTVAVSVTEVTYKLNGNTSIGCKGEMQVRGRSYGLADQTFYASNIAAGAVTADKVAAGAVTADKISAGAVNADKIATGAITVSNMSADAQAAMLNSNVNVGGRNYIFNSAGVKVSGLGSTAGSRNEYKALNVGQSYMSIPSGTNVVISFDLYMTVNTANPTLQVYNTNNICPKTFAGVTKYFTASVGAVISQRVSIETTISDRENPTVQSNYIEFYSVYGTSNWYSISNIKMEIGNKATDWTPAPEDTTNQEQRIYYRSSSATAPTAPTTWVTSTSTANATWTTKRMQYDSTYKYLYTCIQRRDASGNISNSTVLLDDTTTVIDGGNIITGTVVANKIASNAVTSDKIQAGAVTADKISVTDLQALGATIAGWNIGTDRISKTVSGKSAVISSSIPSVIMSKTNNSAEINGNAEIIAQRYVSDDNNGYTKLLGRELSQITEIWEVHATWADYIRKNESLMADGTLTLKGRDIDPETLYLEDNFKTAVLNYKDLTFNGHSLKRLTPHLTQIWSTEIPKNADLNTTTYLKVGQYFCPTGANAATLTNYPAASLNDAFTMTVEAPIQTTYDNETSTWVYRLRKITTGNGRQYLQMCYVGGTAGSWDYGVWKLVPTSIGYSSTDLNTIRDSGLYVNGSSNSNAPTTWSGLITCGGAFQSWGAHQLAFNVEGMWTRSYTGSPLAWTSWVKIIRDTDSVTDLSSTGNITTATSMTYTGKSLTFPTAGWWAIEGYANYSNGAPQAASICQDAGSYYWELDYSERHTIYDKTVNYIKVSFTGYFEANGVVKLFAKYSNASLNGVGIRAKKLH